MYEAAVETKALKKTVEIMREIQRVGLITPGPDYVLDLYDKLVEIKNNNATSAEPVEAG